MSEKQKIQLDPKNARVHDKRNKEIIQKSLEKLGAGRSIVMDNDNYIIAGNGVYEQAQALGIPAKVIETDGSELMIVKRTDLAFNDVRRKEMAIVDNAATDASKFDYEVFKDEYFENVPFDEWIEMPETENPETKDDEFEMPNKVETSIVLGDLIEFKGNGLIHRLICGDSTDADVVGKLLIGEVPTLMATDPPYGVSYNPEWRNEAAEKGLISYADRSIGKVENDDRVDWTESYSLFPGDVVYVWHASLFGHNVAKNLEDCGFNLISQIVWVKPMHAISRGDYHWQHESCLYAVKKNKTHNWQGSRSETTVWKIERGCKDKTGHGTEKPIECMAKPIKNNTSKGQSVYDPFLGSGTTMIAAHQLERNCYGIEISPEYCQVIINRMKALDPSVNVTINDKPYETPK